MAIPAIGNTTTTGTNTSSADVAAKSLGGDFQNFLRLLTTQLKNQDPTEPLDTNQFTQQIAMLSQVEQTIATNKNLEKLVALAGGSQIDNAVSYIGRSVDAAGNKGVLPPSGLGEFAYNAPAGTKTVQVTITNAAGQAVFQGAGTTQVGKNVVFWDGKNSFNNNVEAPGVYTLTVQAKDASGTELPAKTYTSGNVSSVDMKDGNVVLSIGGVLDVKLEDVLSVRQSA